MQLRCGCLSSDTVQQRLLLRRILGTGRAAHLPLRDGPMRLFCGLLTLAALSATPSCGGETRRPDAARDDDGAGGRANTSGTPTTGGRVPAGSGSGGGDAGASGSEVAVAGAAGAVGGGDEVLAPTVCAGFADIWAARSRELEPGEPTPYSAAPSPCYDCIARNESEDECALPVGRCNAFNDCARRHCLCVTPDSCLRGDELCACLSRCGASEAACAVEWNRYMSCTSRNCGDACR